MKSLTETKLVNGAKYDVDSLELSDWTGPADTDTLFYGNYFDSDGVYLGADEDGNEPLFAGNPQPISETERFAVKRYSDNVTIGHVTLTPEQYSRYESMSQQPEGLAKIGELPHDLYDLDAEYQDSHQDTVIFLE